MPGTIAVIGGGYGGSLVASQLDAVADVVLVDPREAFVNAAGSLRALTRPQFAPEIFFPFDRLLGRGRVIRDRAVSADPAGVRLASGARVDADYLVLATGSGYPFPAKPRDSATTVAAALADLAEAHRELAAAGSVLIRGAGPVGLELAGEIRAVWPGKAVTVATPAATLLPGFLPEVRAELHRQLERLGIGLRLATDPDTLRADLSYRAHGVRIAGGYLADGRLTRLTERGTVPVTDRLTVQGHDHVYALGDLADLPDPKMASYAQEQAAVVVANLRAQLAGARPEAVHTPSPHRRILLPLGPHAGVGQLPSPDGPVPASLETVIRRKGADLFTARFAERFACAGSRP